MAPTITHTPSNSYFRVSIISQTTFNIKGIALASQTQKRMPYVLSMGFMVWGGCCLVDTYKCMLTFAFFLKFCEIRYFKWHIMGKLKFSGKDLATTQ